MRAAVRSIMAALLAVALSGQQASAQQSARTFIRDA